MLQHRVDLPQAKALAEQRRSIIARMEDEYIGAWDELFSHISEAQDEVVVDLYRDEFKILPHPTLGLRSAAPR